MPDDATLASRVHGNIESIEELRKQAEHELSPRQAMIERTVRAIARPATLFALLTLAIVWVALNASLSEPFDPAPFFGLQGVFGLYAALVTTMVLITQSRQRQEDERRAHLDLHINLLAEQKATKIIDLLEELRRDMPNVRDRVDPTADAMAEEVDPKTVHEALRTRS